ncbi:DNA polymerase III subunit delta [Deinococcus yavapaiensis]|uniref:DNA-directed DNA polymerase n=1 Tax=Deinococcus yavapaiensis KR-236 TaxID=694435 RepID=A0A318SCU3_9DEIO|nr:DNA polymerase III subunit delta [Deinococcus yavapaiensis]PYE56463.1 DNA polymerase III delta subunit [Deinococcus yavapaiensis KR-236]
MILAFGGHRYLVEEAARRSLTERRLNMRDVTRLGGEDVTAEKLAPLLAPSLFGDSVVIVDFDGVKVGKDVLELVRSAQGALVVILDPSAPVTRQKVYREAGEFVSTPAPEKVGDVAGWAAQRARERKLKLERDAALYLAEVFGSDLASIDSELEKLSFVDGKLDRALVSRVVGKEAPGDSFAMLGAATSGKPAEALAQLRRLLASGEDPFKLMGAVVWQYSLVARCVAVLQDEPSANEHIVSTRLGVKPYPAKKAMEVARRVDERKSRAQLSRIVQADLAMKSGGDPATTLERLLVSLSL